jgi:phosphatidate cytidylyltransferase
VDDGRRGPGQCRLLPRVRPLGIGAIATSAILVDRPAGYLRRVGLGALAFMLFGCGLGHLGFLANDPAARPMLLMLIACVQLNDVFAFVAGKALGRRRLAPHTSPGKTWAGAIGALVTTAPLAALLGHAVFRGTPLDRPAKLLLLGVLLSTVGVLGDLTLSSIKRDLGIKDMGAAIPGHGGVLDRLNSLLFTAPVFFHYVVHAGGATAGIGG